MVIYLFSKKIFKRYLVKRRITRIRYLTKKYYRRYLSISPAVRQRRQLNRDFKYVPKTNLALSYQMNLDQLMYCNIFDRERSRFQTIRDREALIKILKMPCVQGVASEVAFLLKVSYFLLFIYSKIKWVLLACFVTNILLYVERLE